MGKNIIPQKRGHGSPTYRSPSHRHFGDIKLPRVHQGEGVVLEILQAPGRTAPLARVAFDRREFLMIAPDGLSVGQRVTVGAPVEGYPGLRGSRALPPTSPQATTGTPAMERGNVAALRDIPEGTLVYDIEVHPGDGGKFCRAAGTTAVVVSQGEVTVIQLPSGAFRTLNPKCRAAIGVVASGGHRDKPITKAGKNWHIYRSRAHRPFHVRGVAMNSVSHPHGGGSHQHVGRPSTVAYNAPPGRKVGRLSPKPKRVKAKIRRR